METNNKMREALERIRDLAYEVADINSEGGARTALPVQWVVDTVTAALDEPVRNCERFKTKEDAALAFANECKQWIPQSVLWQLAPWLDWLFAEAKKGGAK